MYELFYYEINAVLYVFKLITMKYVFPSLSTKCSLALNNYLLLLQKFCIIGKHMKFFKDV